MRAAGCVVCVMLIAALGPRAEPQMKLAPLDPVRMVHVGPVNQPLARAQRVSP